MPHIRLLLIASRMQRWGKNAPYYSENPAFFPFQAGLFFFWKELESMGKRREMIRAEIRPTNAADEFPTSNKLQLQLQQKLIEWLFQIITANAERCKHHTTTLEKSVRKTNWAQNELLGVVWCCYIEQRQTMKTFHDWKKQMRTTHGFWYLNE